MSLWTLLCYFIAIMYLFSEFLSIDLQSGSQLLNVTFSLSSARCVQWPGFALIRVSCHYVMLLDCVCCKRLICTRLTFCCELPSDSTRDTPELKMHGAHSFQFEDSGCRMSQSTFLPVQVHMQKNLPYSYTLLDALMLDGFKGTVPAGNQRFIIFFLMSFKNRYSIGNNV